MKPSSSTVAGIKAQSVSRVLRTFLLTISFMLLAGVVHAAEVVNLNKADAAAIQQSLVGIGPIKAEAIVAYRKKNGRFKDVDDLLNVKGIGPGTIKKNKRYLSLSKGVVSGDAKKYSAAKKQAKAKQASGGSSSKSKSSSSKSSTSKTTAKKAKKESSTKKSAKNSSESSSTAKKAKKSTAKKKSTSKTSKTSKSKKCDGVKKSKDCKPKKASKKKSTSKSKSKSKKKKAPAT